MKKILSVLLAVCLLVGCVPFYAAADTIAPEDKAYVQFDNESNLKLTPAKPYLCLDGDTNTFTVKAEGEVTDGNWKAKLELTKDGENVTAYSLTIKDLTAYDISFERVIDTNYQTIPATLIFQGTSTIGNDTMNGGLSANDCDFTIKGEDASSRLTVYGGILLGGSTGKTITFESGTVNATGRGSGIKAYGDIAVAGANVTGTGTTAANNQDNVYGVYANDITVTGGTLMGITDSDYGGNTYGIYANIALNVSGGSVIGKGDKTSSSTGITARDSFTASSSTVQGTGRTYGISLGGTVNISGSAKVTGMTDSDNYSYNTHTGIDINTSTPVSIGGSSQVTGSGAFVGINFQCPVAIDGATVTGTVIDGADASKATYGIKADTSETNILTFKSGTVTGDASASDDYGGPLGLVADKLGFGCSMIQYTTTKTGTLTEYTPAAGTVFGISYGQKYFSMKSAGEALGTPITVTVGEVVHNHVWSTAWTTDETHHWHECTGAGTCGITDNSAKDGYAEHSWGTGSVTQEPTTEAEGQRTYTCECGKTKTETIPKIHTHVWNTDAWAYDGTHHWHPCTNEGCNENDTADENCGYDVHTWDEGTITKQPTATEKGVKTFTCTVCEATKTEDIAATGGGNTGGNTGNQGGNTGGNTGTTPAPAPKDEVTTTPTVSGGTANTTVSSSDGASLVEAAKQPGTGEVIVKVEPKEDVTAANVTLPASTVTGVGAAKTDLTVETPVADITLPSAALTELGRGAGNVTVSAAVNDDETVSIDVKKDNTVVKALAQPMKAVIPAENVTSSTVAYLVDENGNETIIPKSISGKEEMRFPLKGSAKIKLLTVEKAFVDTQGHWADKEGAIGFAFSRQLFKGTSDTSFSPNTTMTRGMMVTVLHRLESTPKGSSVSFGDVSGDDYFAEAVAWGAENKIVEGTGGNSFAPGRDVTREQLATFLYRYAKAYGVDTAGRTNLASFPDSGNVSGYAKDALEWACNAGLMKGSSDGKLNPTGSAKRGEVAAILMRFVEYINK